MVVQPREALNLLNYIGWIEDCLLAGYHRLALIYSFLKNDKALDNMWLRGAIPSFSTLYCSYQGFTDKQDPIPDLGRKRASMPSAYRMVDGIRIKLHGADKDSRGAYVRLVVTSLSPHGKVGVLDVSVVTGWNVVAESHKKKHLPLLPKVLVSDRVEGRPLALIIFESIHQLCIFLAPRAFDYALYLDGFTKVYRNPLLGLFETVDGVHVTQNKFNAIDSKDQACIQQLLEQSDETFHEIIAVLHDDLFLYAVAYLNGLVEDSLGYLLYLLQTGKKLVLSFNRLGSILSRGVLHFNKIERRWSPQVAVCIPGAIEN